LLPFFYKTKGMAHREFFVLFFLFSAALTLPAQAWDLSFVSSIDERIKESSGLVEVQGRWITHNDSGNSPHLYEMNIATGMIVREVVIGNQSHIDWEDICADDEFIYIGDFGNNLGTRKNLRILKVGITDFFSSDTVQAIAIDFEYADQISFDPRQFQTNFDAEALISYGDSLYVFTKNWSDFKTNIYPLPKNAGSYVAFRYDSIDINLMVTGGDTDVEGNLLGLVGYNFSQAFFISFPLDQLGRLHLLSPSPQSLITQGSYQVEGFAFESDSRAFLTSENSFGGDAALFLLSEESTNIISPYAWEDFTVIPNPSSGLVRFSGADFFEVKIYSSSGEWIKTCYDSVCFLSSLPFGQYIALFYNREGVLIGNEKVIFY